MLNLTDLQRLKLRRAINRRKNGLVEKLLKLIAKIQAQLDALDAEQDAANIAMKEEQARIKERAAYRVAELKAEIADTEKQALSDVVTTEQTFGAIAAEAKAEAETVRKVQKNLKALTA